MIVFSLDCVWSLDINLNMLRLDQQNCVGGGGGEHDQIGSGRDVNEVGYYQNVTFYSKYTKLFANTIEHFPGNFCITNFWMLLLMASSKMRLSSISLKY